MHWRLLRLTRQVRGQVQAWLHPRATAWECLCRQPERRPVLAHLPGGLRLRIYPGDIIGRDIFVQGLYEPGECRFVQRTLKPGMVFCDVGANIGQYTVLAAQRVGPTGQVHSFEPSPRGFAELQFNVTLNNLDRVCQLNQVALFDTPGTRSLSRYPPGREVWGSLGRPCWETQAIAGFDEVTTTTLDEYVAERGLARVDLVKFDIEGAELPALRGARRLLQRPDAPTLIVELADLTTAGFGYAALDTWDYLTELGYALHAADARGRLGPALRRPARLPGPLNFVARKEPVRRGRSARENRICTGGYSG